MRGGGDRPTSPAVASPARLLASYIEAGLFPALLPLITAGRLQEVRNAFTVSDGNGTFTGKGRALDILVNVVFPLFHAWAVAWAVMERETALVSRCLRLAEESPRLAENELTREMAVLLNLPARNFPIGALRQQGLMHLYRRLLQDVPSSDCANLLKDSAAIHEVTGCSWEAIIVADNAESRPGG